MESQAGLIAKVHGRVQGVFFRAFTSDMAVRLKLTGYAKNLPDGTVLVEAEGEKKKLEDFLHHLHTGPQMAQVDKVETSWSVFENRFSGFRTL
ncbi:acylphosphatase [Chloroflexota bacterium]